MNGGGEGTLYGRVGTRGGLWPFVGALLVARAVGAVVTVLIATLLRPSFGGAPITSSLAISGASLSSDLGLAMLAISSVICGLAFRPALRYIAELEINPVAAIAVFAIGNVVTAVAFALLNGGPGSPVIALTPLLLIATVTVEALLAQTLSYPTVSNNATAVRSYGLSSFSFYMLLWVAAVGLLLLIRAGKLHLHLGSTATTAANVQLVDQQMGNAIRELDQGLQRPKTLRSMTCTPFKTQPQGFGHDPIYGYFSCTAAFTSGQRQGWCLAYDTANRMVGTYYEGARACAGPADPEIKP